MNQIADAGHLEAIPYESKATWKLNKISSITDGGELEWAFRHAIYVHGLGFGDQETTLQERLLDITL